MGDMHHACSLSAYIMIDLMPVMHPCVTILFIHTPASRISSRYDRGITWRQWCWISWNSGDVTHEDYL